MNIYVFVCDYCIICIVCALKLLITKIKGCCIFATTDMIDERSIKANIRRIRERMGLTQEAIAQELDIESSTYWRLEEGTTQVINRNVYRIARLADIAVEDLVVGDEVSRKLRDADDSQEKLEALRAFYEKKLQEKDELVTNLNNYIKTLQK